MATNDPDESQKETECPVCYEQFVKPKRLPCSHTVCLRCLQTLANMNQNFTCPVCRKETKIPTGGVKSFSNDQQMISLVRNIKSGHGDIPSDEAKRQTGISPAESGLDFSLNLGNNDDFNDRELTLAIEMSLTDCLSNEPDGNRAGDKNQFTDSFQNNHTSTTTRLADKMEGTQHHATGAIGIPGRQIPGSHHRHLPVTFTRSLMPNATGNDLFRPIYNAQRQNRHHRNHAFATQRNRELAFSTRPKLEQIDKESAGRFDDRELTAATELSLAEYISRENYTSGHVFASNDDQFTEMESLAAERSIVEEVTKKHLESYGGVTDDEIDEMVNLTAEMSLGGHVAAEGEQLEEMTAIATAISLADALH